MLTCLTGGNFLGWFNFNEIFKISNFYKSAVYCFAVVNKLPEKYILPFSVPGTFYIGESGTNDFSFDQKTKKKGRFETSFHRRMKDHSYNLIKKVKEELKDDEFVCIAIFVPKDVEFNDYTKHWQKSVESELIGMYGLVFSETPKYNAAHKNSDLKKDGSISKRNVEQLKKSNLEDFLSE
jgi:hypothetical protein